MYMNWETVELLKAVLCMAAIALMVILYLMQKVNARQYSQHILAFALVMTACGVLAYFNFGMFHWNKYPHSVHYYDIYHYHIGGKYFAELGYFDLYHATVIADQEHNKRFERIKNFTHIRDLRSDRVIPWRMAMRERDRIVGNFTPERWESFKRDIDSFQRQMPSRHWRHTLKDYGYNPPPPWSLMGRVVANLFDISHVWQMVAMAWVDVLLLAIGFIFLYKAFGLYPLIFALTFFGVNYTHRYQHMSGSLLRLDWLAYLLIGISLLKLKRPKTAGAFLAYSAMLRVFPIMFLAGIGFKWLWNAIKERKIMNDDFKTLLSALAAVIVIFSLTLVVKPGLDGWKEWGENIAHHSQRLTVKRIALPYIFINYGRFSDSNMKQSMSQREARAEANKVAIRTIQVVVLALFVVVAAHSPTWAASILGMMLIYLLVNPVRYYWASLVLLIPWLVTFPLKGKKVIALAWLFGAMIIDFAIDSTTREYTLHQYFASWALGLLFAYVLYVEGSENGSWKTLKGWARRIRLPA
jgi:hypothetical protein